MCTDENYANQDILKVYKLRWRIEVCYREVKQNHAFGRFHARTYETIYGQTMLSLVAYIFVSFFRWLIPSLHNESLGAIVQNYFCAIVTLSSRHSQKYDTIEFPPWIMQLGLLPWHTFVLP